MGDDERDDDEAVDTTSLGQKLAQLAGKPGGARLITVAIDAAHQRGFLEGMELGIAMTGASLTGEDDGSDKPETGGAN